MTLALNYFGLLNGPVLVLGGFSKNTKSTPRNTLGFDRTPNIRPLVSEL
jgi:hypothetical protein